MASVKAYVNDLDKIFEEWDSGSKLYEPYKQPIKINTDVAKYTKKIILGIYRIFKKLCLGVLQIIKFIYRIFLYIFSAIGRLFEYIICIFKNFDIWTLICIPICILGIISFIWIGSMVIECIIALATM